jgi:hypothetical protein
MAKGWSVEEMVEATKKPKSCQPILWEDILKHMTITVITDDMTDQQRQDAEHGNMLVRIWTNPNKKTVPFSILP